MPFAHLLTRQTSRATQGPLSSRTLVTEPEPQSATAEPLLCLSVAVSLSPEKFNTCYDRDRQYFQAFEMYIFLTFFGKKIN